MNIPMLTAHEAHARDDKIAKTEAAIARLEAARAECHAELERLAPDLEAAEAAYNSAHRRAIQLRKHFYSGVPLDLSLEAHAQPARNAHIRGISMATPDFRMVEPADFEECRAALCELTISLDSHQRPWELL